MSKLIITASLFIIIFVGLSYILSTSESPPENAKKKTRQPVVEESQNEPRWVENQIPSAEKSLPALPFSLSENEAETEKPPNPLPIEWEEPFFDILDNSKTREERNSRLYLFASTTAQVVPRVQEECLAHLSFGIDESEKDLALQILKDPRISESAKILMFENLQKVRSDEFIYFLASQLTAVLPKTELREITQKTLGEFDYSKGQ